MDKNYGKKDLVKDYINLYELIQEKQITNQQIQTMDFLQNKQPNLKDLLIQESLPPNLIKESPIQIFERIIQLMKISEIQTKYIDEFK